MDSNHVSCFYHNILARKINTTIGTFQFGIGVLLCNRAIIFYSHFIMPSYDRKEGTCPQTEVKEIEFYIFISQQFFSSQA